MRQEIKLKMKKLPWLEIILVAILLLMIVSSISALFGQDLRQGIDHFCTANSLWCAISSFQQA